ncbi:MAG: DUF4932 domain-containing protein [Bacteroidales bacterium]|nr:DUF4932 domain-containing protein [Bacteroidales bacterium]
MKKVILSFILLVFMPLLGISQTEIPVSFDERADLMAVVFRLADCDEYNRCLMEEYAAAVDNYFEPYKTHEVIALAKEYHETAVSYDAVESYALHLVLPNDNQGLITIDSDFKEGGDKSFDRWTEQQKQDFLAPLSDFYHKSHFHEWYESTFPVRNQAVETFNSNIRPALDFSWFDTFFGPCENADLKIYLSFLVGGNNYGCSSQRIDGQNVFSPVIGCAQPDSLGNACYQIKIVLPIVIHEFCHAYCNPLNAKYWAKMEKKADKVFELKKEELTWQAYGSSFTMMNETFVRSCVIRYIMAHNPNADIKSLIANEKSFLLTQTMVESLAQYEKQRNVYPDIESYMPQLIKDINGFNVRKYKKELKAYQKQCAHVVSCSIKNGSTDIPAGKSEMTITFDKPMQNSIHLGKGNDGGEFPSFAGAVMESFSWSEDQKTITVQFDLKPNTHYSFSILGDHFFSVDGYPTVGTHFISFTTRKE